MEIRLKKTAHYLSDKGGQCAKLSRNLSSNTLTFGTQPEPDYAREDLVRVVTQYGRVHLRNSRGFILSNVFINQPIGLTEIENQLWRVSFMNYELGIVDEKTESFKPNDYLTMSPMS